jgi:two-component system response regulator MprA
VLVVEDDAGLQETLQAVLTLEGYEVIIAGDGLDALAKVDRHRPALVVLDLMMPRLDGFGFVAALEQRGLRPGLPILILTADGRAPQKARQLRAEGCLTKPFDLDLLLGEVARLARGATGTA